MSSQLSWHDVAMRISSMIVNARMEMSSDPTSVPDRPRIGPYQSSTRRLQLAEPLSASGHVARREPLRSLVERRARAGRCARPLAEAEDAQREPQVVGPIAER